VNDDEVRERDADADPDGPAVTDPDGPDEAEQPEEEKAATDGNVTKLHDTATRRGRSVAARNAEAEADGPREPEEEGEQGELFVWEQGRKVTLGNLISKGVPVEYAFVFGGKRLKGNGQLIGMEDDVLMISRGKMGHTKLVPTRNDDETVKSVVVEVQVVPKVLQNADTEAGIEMLRPILEKHGWKKVDHPEAAAAAE
jgi:hypothetical protein